MARPRKRGLDYFPMDIDLFWNEKVFALTEKYGTKGQAVYIALLCEIYREGYYIEIPAERMAGMIMRSVGTHCFESRKEVIEMLDCCAALGLLDRELYSKGVMTSEGIQRRYAEVTARRKNSREEYWLLPSPKKKSAEKEKEAAEEDTSFFNAETTVSVCSNATNKTKENQTKQNQSKPNQIKSDKTAPEPQPQTDCADTEPEYLCGWYVGGKAADDEMMIEKVMDEFEKIRPVTAQERQRIAGLCGVHGADRVMKAVEETVRRGGKSLAYAEKVLATMTAPSPVYRASEGMCGEDSCSGIYTEEYIRSIMDDGI